MFERQQHLVEGKVGGEIGAVNARAVEAGAFEPSLGNVDAANLFSPGLFHSQNLFDLLYHLRWLDHDALGHGLQLIA